MPLAKTINPYTLYLLPPQIFVLLGTMWTDLMGLWLLLGLGLQGLVILFSEVYLIYTGEPLYWDRGKGPN